MPYNSFQIGIGSVVAIGRCKGDIPQHRCAEPISVLKQITFGHAPHVAGLRIEPARLAGAEGGKRKRIKILIAQQRARMT